MLWTYLYELNSHPKEDCKSMSNKEMAPELFSTTRQDAKIYWFDADHIAAVIAHVFLNSI
jgi:hypothetical protein